MLVAITDEPCDEGPLGPMLLIEGQHAEVLQRSPFALGDRWVQMVDPPLAAFVGSAQEILAEEGERDGLPVGHCQSEGAKLLSHFSLHSSALPRPPLATLFPEQGQH
jgi:hypothetical protein